MSSDPNRYLALDAMRGVASIIVVVSHLAFRNGWSIDLSANAHLAVDFFFVLSGFVIARAYERRLLDKLSFSEFAMIRIIRLYPLLVLGCVIGIAKQTGQIAAHSNTAMTAAQLTIASAANLIVLPAPFVSSYAAFPLNNPEWSLFCEIAINLAYAYLLVRLKNIVLISMLVIPAFSIVIIGVVTNGTLDIGWNLQTLVFGIARVVFSFPLGMLIARMLAPSNKFKSKWALIPVALLLLVLTTPLGTARVILDLVLLVVVPFFVVAGALLEVPDSFGKLSKFLGDISYPLYAIHFPLIGISLFIQEKFLHLSPLIYTVLYGSCVIAAAAVAGKYYDAPIRRYLDSVFRTRSSAMPQVL